MLGRVGRPGLPTAAPRLRAAACVGSYAQLEVSRRLAGWRLRYASLPRRRCRRHAGAPMGVLPPSILAITERARRRLEGEAISLIDRRE